METVWIIAMGVLLAMGAIIIAMPLYAMPATLSLPEGLRSGIRRLTLAEAADLLRATGKTGTALVEAARALVADRIQYCRRNSFDSPERAFQRGYGYCTQQAYALTELLAQLGIEAKPVYAFRNRFPDGAVGGHTWVRVAVNGEEWEIDSVFYDAEAGDLTFSPLSSVQEHSRLFRLATQWGKAAVNAHRYYRSGKDVEG